MTDDDDVAVEVYSAFLTPGYTARAVHVPTGTVGEGQGETEFEAIAQARDALLAALEVAGGC